MKIYNTLTRQKEEFVPVHPGKVGMYVCGPTVYNYIHIGNARPMIIFDTVRRYFEYKGYEVNYVSNFTDVDDKIIKKANEEGVTATEIAERYIKECKQDMEALNIKPATHQPRATEEIGGMIKMIQTLIKKGHAYEVDGTVYFKTRSFKDYGKLSKKNIDDLEAGHREIKVTGEEGKKDPLDFVLWKPKKEGEIAWDSPWGEGRPGWHIECSEMSKKYIGDTIDIHAGGEDLIFPHHENEIAQSEACNGEKFANYWMHNGFLNINNKKMSKSAGNFFTVREIGEKYPLQVIRFFMLSAHYRTPLNFSDTLVESAKTGLDRILTAIDLCREMAAKEETGSLSKEETEHFANIEVLVKKFEDAMEDDFNTADAVSAIFEIVRESNSTVKDFSADYAKKILKVLEDLCSVLGIETTKEEEILDEEIEKLIEERQAARKNKDFARADEIRDQLLEQGIVLKRYKRRCKMEQSLIQKIKEGLYLDGLDPKSYSPLSLAYIGDAIYEIVIRTIVMSAGNMSVNKYHKKSSSMVKASAQKEVFEKIEPFLTEEEMAVYKRGRNSKSGSVAKNASMMDYRKATGVEALVGYLYLAGDMDRIIELIGIGFDLNKKEETGEEHES